VGKGGRRPGNVDTRAEIVAAARAAFQEEGFNGSSIRAIAQRAGVDPALVHHYFADKSELFMETMQLPKDPQEVAREASAGVGFSGERVVEGFLAQWERDGEGKGSPSFVSVAQAMVSSPEAAKAMREFLADRLSLHGPSGESEAVRHRRRALISSQLFGLGWARYVLCYEPIATASRADVARWAGPTLDRYNAGDFDES
jgi:AcrR family transcriptional regulator